MSVYDVAGNICQALTRGAAAGAGLVRSVGLNRRAAQRAHGGARGARRRAPVRLTFCALTVSYTLHAISGLTSYVLKIGSLPNSFTSRAAWLVRLKWRIEWVIAHQVSALGLELAKRYDR